MAITHISSIVFQGKENWKISRNRRKWQKHAKLVEMEKQSDTVGARSKESISMIHIRRYEFLDQGLWHQQGFSIST